MNYYERYCGDYAKKTAHLSLTEHGAYTMMLDTYYSTERALPAELGLLYRICRAMTKLEQAAVAKVAGEFFPIGPDGLRHQDRADAEITKGTARITRSQQNGILGGNPYLKRQYDEPGTLYAVAIDDSRIKVGITANMTNRRYGLAKTHGQQIQVIHTVTVSNMGASEQRVLEKFADYARGEILTLPNEQRDDLFEAMNLEAHHQPSGVPHHQPSGVADGGASSQPSPCSIPHTLKAKPKDTSANAAAFAAFWEAYPVKKDKKDASKAWAKLSPDQELTDRITAAVAQQVEEWSRSGTYPPHPTTWLNGERWNDELLPLQSRIGGTANAPTLAEKRAQNIEKLTGKVRDERTVEGVAERVGDAPVLSLPGDLREPGSDDVGRRGSG